MNVGKKSTYFQWQDERAKAQKGEEKKGSEVYGKLEQNTSTVSHDLAGRRFQQSCSSTDQMLRSTLHFDYKDGMNHLNLVPGLKIREDIPPLPQYVCKVWCLVKQRGNSPSHGMNLLIEYAKCKNWNFECQKLLGVTVYIKCYLEDQKEDSEITLSCIAGVGIHCEDSSAVSCLKERLGISGTGTFRSYHETVHNRTPSTK
jgi:hypothetical protein